MKKQVYELEGKTIKRVVESAGGESVILLFTDGTFAAYSGGGDDESEWINDGKLDLRGFGDAKLIEAGIATAEDLKRLRTNERRRERRRAAQFSSGFDLQEAMRSYSSAMESYPRQQGRITGLSISGLGEE